jgi:hypothetical protein
MFHGENHGEIKKANVKWKCGHKQRQTFPTTGLLTNTNNLI